MSFATDFAKLLKQAGDKADLVVRKTALSLGKSLVDKCPVDTGRFRGNWQYGTAVNTDTSSANDKTGGVVMGRIAAEIANWRSGQTIYLTNSLPYARSLEYGHSKQAPQGMVRITVADFKQTLRNAIGGAA